jgi:hypothetical protein
MDECAAGAQHAQLHAGHSREALGLAVIFVDAFARSYSIPNYGRLAALCALGYRRWRIVFLGRQ